MLEFVDSDLYFVQDKNNFINPLLQVGPGSVEKSTGSGGPKITGSDRIRILIPGYIIANNTTMIGLEVPIHKCHILRIVP